MRLVMQICTGLRWRNAMF